MYLRPKKNSHGNNAHNQTYERNNPIFLRSFVKIYRPPITINFNIYYATIWPLTSKSTYLYFQDKRPLMEDRSTVLRAF